MMRQPASCRTFGLTGMSHPFLNREAGFDPAILTHGVLPNGRGYAGSLVRGHMRLGRCRERPMKGRVDRRRVGLTCTSK